MLQAGRRSGIAQFFKSRNFPVEVVAYMIQGSFEKVHVVGQKSYTKRELQKVQADQYFR